MLWVMLQRWSRLRRFAEAAGILRRVLKDNPTNYPAHANLATALYELKQYAQAVSEFEWVVANKPEIIVAHYLLPRRTIISENTRSPRGLSEISGER